MLEGPYHSSRWVDRASRFGEILQVLQILAGFLYLCILGYEFWIDREFIKLTFVTIGLLILLVISFFILKPKKSNKPDYLL